MTTQIRITNEGPENAAILYYNQARIFIQHKDLLKPGDFIIVSVWDGNLPVVLPMGNAEKIDSFPKSPMEFFRSPPAFY